MSVLTSLPVVGKYFKSRDKVTKMITPEKPSNVPPEFDHKPVYTRKSFTGHVANSSYYKLVRECWSLYDADELVGASIDHLAEDSTINNDQKRPFEISVMDEMSKSDVTDTEDEIAAYLTKQYNRLKVFETCQSWIRWALVEGSRFYRIILDESFSQVVELRHIKGPKSGFLIYQIPEGEYKDYYVQIEHITQKPVAVFLPWEVIRIDWKKSDEDSYGRPLFARAVRNMGRLTTIEDDMYDARHTTSYAKVVKEYPNATIDELLRVREAEEQDRLRNGPESVESTIYTTGKASLLEGSGNALRNLDDVYYRQDKVFAASRRPKALMAGYGKDAANRAVLDRMEDRYIKGVGSALNGMYETALDGFNKLLLILGGYYPDDYTVSFQWTDKSIEDKKTLGPIIQNGVASYALPLSEYARLLGRDPDKLRSEVEADLEWMTDLGLAFGMADDSMTPPNGSLVPKVDDQELDE